MSKLVDRRQVVRTQKTELYRDKVVRGRMTMEQFARALERDDSGQPVVEPVTLVAEFTLTP